MTAPLSDSVLDQLAQWVLNVSAGPDVREKCMRLLIDAQHHRAECEKLEAELATLKAFLWGAICLIPGGVMTGDLRREAENITAIRAECERLRAALVYLRTVLDSEATMRHWDRWRRAIEDDQGSTPRDMFENWRDGLLNAIEAAFAAETEGT